MDFSKFADGVLGNGRCLVLQRQFRLVDEGNLDPTHAELFVQQGPLLHCPVHHGVHVLLHAECLLACTGRSGDSPLTSMKVDSILGGQASSTATTVVAQSRSGNTQIWAQSGYVFITYTKSSQEPYPTYAATLDTGSRDVVITAAAIDGQSSSFCFRPCPLSSPSPSQFFPLVKHQQTHSLRHQLCRGNQL